jgi:hypothetical protein
MSQIHGACGVIFVLHNITFFEDNEQMCSNVVIQFPLGLRRTFSLSNFLESFRVFVKILHFARKFSYFREQFFTKIYENSESINDVNYSGD